MYRIREMPSISRYLYERHWRYEGALKFTRKNYFRRVKRIKDSAIKQKLRRTLVGQYISSGSRPGVEREGSLTCPCAGIAVGLMPVC